MLCLSNLCFGFWRHFKREVPVFAGASEDYNHLNWWEGSTPVGILSICLSSKKTLRDDDRGPGSSPLKVATI